jgi:class 3 adenylate cyclase
VSVDRAGRPETKPDGHNGATVNIASRIADYARPDEVIVSQAVVDAAEDAPIMFRAIGPVALKGVAAPMRLHAATRPV